ncbi:hypothetical protein FACS1894211_10270 [Clostridia bacterium]|nr:hypothetical protein FACS1894211_10270 [Clostridia bacterium]
MGFLKKRKKSGTTEVCLNLIINAKLQPLDRGAIFENPLDALLKKVGCGYIDGGGTLLDGEGKEFVNCDISIYLTDDSTKNRESLIAVLNTLAPKGSKLCEDGKADIEVGVLEGFAVYLNGTDLPGEVYKTSDVNLVITKIKKAFGNECLYTSYWQGPTETALYYYGTSFNKMKELATPFLDSYPLCQKCRTVQIA